jgi:hypothetical protein
MESEPASRPGPDEASLALADALDARHRLADSLVLPSYFFSSIGVAIAVQIASSAAVIASQDLRGCLLLIGG